MVFIKSFSYSSGSFLGPQPAVTHLHGAEAPSAYDGGPGQWWTPGAEGDLTNIDRTLNALTL